MTRELGGILAAMSDGLDKAGNEVCRTSLKSGKHETYLSVIPELEEVGENDLYYVELQFTDIDLDTVR